MRIAILGCSGKMGINLLKEVEDNKDTILSGGIVRSNSGFIGKDLGLIMGRDEIGISASDDIDKVLKDSDAIIDFTNPETSMEIIKHTAKLKKIHMIGTTGFSEKEKTAIKAYSNDTTVVLAPNTSIGVNLLLNLVENTAKILDQDFDIEILEMHHRHKKDSPSGTAYALGEAAFNGRYGKKGNKKLEDVSCKFRDGIIGARPKDEIGFATLRGGSTIGQHSVIFAGSGERIEIGHIAEDRKIFANGAVRATIWANGKKTGIYTMKDVLGIK